MVLDFQAGVSIATDKMNKIIEINAEDFDCTVEAGVTWRELNQNLSNTGLFFPIGTFFCLFTRINY